jgi:aspartate carbamoyltransferase catalytic subunit
VTKFLLQRALSETERVAKNIAYIHPKPQQRALEIKVKTTESLLKDVF